MVTSKLSTEGNLTKCWGITCDGLVSHPGGVAILLVISCYVNQDKLQRYAPFDLCPDFTLTFRIFIYPLIQVYGIIYFYSNKVHRLKRYGRKHQVA